ncbi:uncharacterized protein BO80DRAFT_23463 [Aspergillus ibericus CBS 121593]|uniref:Uncharacterized protein n=1 Tax=Aspergillus ibericus CBS 121593 TaxID=1448316 RepID=A0A395H5X9_9EURO|nr:hypothetical protein BO80DRAFT_23463 [Aspergillus ibericus CBS 121593]RAL03023.1 hypothetical protein BO80DRAFT_23463 [Aspergillus ibericus CBS 121593]
MFAGIEDRPGRWAEAVLSTSSFRVYFCLFFFFMERHGLRAFSRDAPLWRRGRWQGARAWHCILDIVFFFFSFGFPSSSARFDNRDHWRITVLIMVGIQWNGLCWGCWGIPFEPAKFRPAATDLGHLRGTWIGSRACDKTVLGVHNSCTVLHLIYCSRLVFYKLSAGFVLSLKSRDVIISFTSIAFQR